ncbi:unnamed protein product [Fusarium graminearum]|nr:unnamed protein product [Fusarium graminearum]
MCWCWCCCRGADASAGRCDLPGAGCAGCQLPAAAEQVVPTSHLTGYGQARSDGGPWGLWGTDRIARSANPGQPMTRQDKQLVMTQLNPARLPPNGHLYPTLTPRAKGGKPHGLDSGVKGRCQLRIQAFAWRAKSSIWALCGDS